ncbi:MAG: histidine phosphatase family protein, partial [Coprobacillus sp.]
MNIYITRHSQTVWNEEKRLQGSQDSPLTVQGESNALALRNYIK